MTDSKKTDEKPSTAKSTKLIKGHKKETAPVPCRPMYGG
jgi:hypothetical protein